MDHPSIIRYNKNCLTFRCNEALRKEAEPRVEFKPLYFFLPSMSGSMCLFLCVIVFVSVRLHNYFLAVYMDAFWK